MRSHRHPRYRSRVVRTLQLAVAMIAACSVTFATRNASAGSPRERGAPNTLIQRLFPQGVATLDGGNNNQRHPEWGESGTAYTRNAGTAYADGISEMPGGPPARYVSNRVFNDVAQNLFSENGATQWVYTWGQFVDHTIGLEQAGPNDAPIAFDPGDPLEGFVNNLGSIAFGRTPGTWGTGVTTAREHTNTVSSYIDAWAVYGGTDERLEWMREGPVDGDLSNNSARLLMPGGYLPRSDARGNVATAPAMDHMGRLQGAPQDAVVAGDVRANENIALTSVQTLFAREHNRIVGLLPASLTEQLKFDIARRIVSAEEQYITYNEFLPSVGVRLAPYRGYNPKVNASISNEFAVVGYRAHSMVHGEIEGRGAAADYTPEQLQALEDAGVEVQIDGDEVGFVVPLNIAFGNPGLVPNVGLESVLAGLAGERQYKNDEQIDNQMRSVLFQIPGPNVTDPSKCLDGPTLPECFQGVVDLAAIDIQRGRDHGIPNYNDLRRAFGLPAKASFKAITGENSDAFPADAEINPADAINDPDILDFTELRDSAGHVIDPNSPEAESSAVIGKRRSALAARLKAIYGDVSKVDAFVGMVSEPHVRGTEFGELQLAMWKKQFRALRDGDRFFYLNDPSLNAIDRNFHVGYRHSLAEIISLNTDLGSDEIQPNVFKFVEETPPPATPTPLPPNPTATPTRTAVAGNCGDVTGDGKVDLADVIAEAQAILEGSSSPRYDVNRDGKVDQADAIAIGKQVGTRCSR